MSAHRVLGIDPGTRLCGWGVVDQTGNRLAHVDNGVISAANDRAALAVRLERIYAGLQAVIADLQPTVVAVEDVYVGHGNARTALALGHARGVALLAAARAGLDVHTYTAPEVKKAVSGSGRASKVQVQQMVRSRFDLPEVPQSDAADALAVALCHAQHVAVGAPKAPGPKARKGGRAALEAWVARREGES